MSVEKFLFENFQTHARFELSLSEGITTICGPSDSGKSSLIRGIRWLFQNKPKGGAFCRWGSKLVRVRGKVDGHKLTRERNGSDNLYKLDGDEFRAFRDEVPPAIQSLLRVNDYSFAGQHDPPFWVGMSPPELARQLNKLVDLDVIDLVTSRVSSRIRQYTVEERVVGERYKDACGRVTATAYVPTMDEILQSLESLQSEIHQLRQRSLGLNQLVAEIKWDQQRLAQLKGLLIKGKVLARKGGELINRQNWYNKVKAIVDDINQLQRKTGRPVPDLSELTKLKEECEALVKREEGLSGLLEVVASSERELKGLKERLVAARKQLKEETKGLCPICGGKLKDE